MRKRFDKDGKIIIPKVPSTPEGKESELFILNQVFCPNGHNLINTRVDFNGAPGILFRVKQKEETGLVALSPRYGEKCRISLDIDLIDQQLLTIICPVCNVELPVLSPCTCGGDLIALFLTPDRDYANCIGICNRVNCKNAQIIKGGQLVKLMMSDTT